MQCSHVYFRWVIKIKFAKVKLISFKILAAHLDFYPVSLVRNFSQSVVI